MGKNKKKSSKNQRVTDDTRAKEKGAEERVTMKALEEMSDSDDEEIPEIEWSTKARNLRKEIEDGKFDKILGALKKTTGETSNDEGFEEDTLDDDSSDNEEKTKGEANASETKNDNRESVSGESQNDDDDSDDDGSEPGSAREDHQPIKAETPGGSASSDDEKRSNDGDDGDEFEKEVSFESDEDDDRESDVKDEKAERLAKNNKNNAKALTVVTADLVASHANLPWPETFHIIPSTPLPFGENDDEDNGTVDIHDDLKREVTFYNSALEAVHQARAKCKEAGIPFSRPDDFFAEMVKTDDHMAKVKDRLIFETKKMDAVAQRKANREQKLRSKESHANKLAEKAKRKREHFQEVEEWAHTAAKSRGGALRDDADEIFLKKGPNKKREAANRKFGFGGKRGRFKQNDRASMNDVSGFNPRGNFPGMGTKKSAKSRSASGAARPGKRARDSKRARK